MSNLPYHILSAKPCLCRGRTIFWSRMEKGQPSPPGLLLEDIEPSALGRVFPSMLSCLFKRIILFCYNNGAPDSCRIKAARVSPVFVCDGIRCREGMTRIGRVWWRALSLVFRLFFPVADGFGRFGDNLEYGGIINR